MGVADGVLDGGQHVDLRGHVQRRRRLVEHDQVRLRAQRHRRHHPLQLPAGNLVRIAAADIVGVGQAELAEQRARPLLGLAAAGHAMQQRGFHHLVHQLVRRVEGCRGRLGDIAHLAPAHRADAARPELEDVAAVQHHLAAGDAHPATAIGHGRQADGGLAGTGFADQPQHLALLQRQRHVVDERDRFRLLAGRVDPGLYPQVADVEQRVGVRVAGRSPSHCRALP